MKKYNTAFYLILIYVIMQLSGIVFAPLIFDLLMKQDGMEIQQAKLMASGWWVFISMAVATLISVFIIRKNKSFLNNLKGKQSSIGASIGWGVVGFFMVLFGQALAAFIENALGIDPGSENTAAFIKIADAAPVAILSIAIFAPILEELIFRRVIFGSLVQKTNFFIAGAVSAIVFAIIHFDFTHILLYAVSGFIFAFLYYKTRRIMTSIISHMLLNGFVVLVQLNADNIERYQKYLETLSNSQ
ncbi:CPBP family intramembrane glutamic endopeptidase [Paenisporosarcina antarctica]|uniref:CPBP family intramembrane metalloprotease n=1 Tax=Paenisporosarcina antarctica TaxID=417367 RepID=A0A4P6ZVA9_9BACL|nr:type II CAAX endopeptidase family protein [Paenisporosarcina antarctica]QBP40064.1 CPBP family intramembrane metalloprotease [Paenisporosarcina antarctica]